MFLFFLFFQFFHHLALTIAMHLRVALVYTELISDHLLIDLIVCTEAKIDHALRQYHECQ